MIDKVKKIIKISKLEAHVKTPPETSVSTPWGILFGNMCGYNTINHTNLYSVSMIIVLNIQK